MSRARKERQDVQERVENALLMTKEERADLKELMLQLPLELKNTIVEKQERLLVVTKELSALLDTLFQAEDDLSGLETESPMK